MHNTLIISLRRIHATITNKNKTKTLSYIFFLFLFLDYHKHHKDRLWAPKDVETRAEKRVFQHPPRGPADANILEKHVCALLLHKTLFSLENFTENAPESLFSCTLHWSWKTRYLQTFWKRRFQGRD